MQVVHLKKTLDRLFHTYDIHHISSDPLVLVHGFKQPEDQEVAGLIAAVFAYGRVAQIQKTVRTILDRMEGSPYKFIRGFEPDRDAEYFRGIVHRFNNGTDILCLIFGLKKILKKYGSIKELFLKGYDSRHEDIGEALSAFVDSFLNLDYSPIMGTRVLPRDAGVRFLFPSPRDRSACKRLNMYLRWMVRRDDGLDLGLWREVSPSKLVIPLDTHLFRISSRLGLTRRRSPDWETAREVTRNLKLLDPSDPVKYDFALARLGILKQCTKQRDIKQCKICPLHRICSYERRKLKGP
ncbi:MAG: TIGR02757 family protein [bacterium]